MDILLRHIIVKDHILNIYEKVMDVWKDGEQKQIYTGKCRWEAFFKFTASPDIFERNILNHVFSMYLERAPIPISFVFDIFMVSVGACGVFTEFSSYSYFPGKTIYEFRAKSPTYFDK